MSSNRNLTKGAMGVERVWWLGGSGVLGSRSAKREGGIVSRVRVQLSRMSGRPLLFVFVADPAISKPRSIVRASSHPADATHRSKTALRIALLEPLIGDPRVC